MSTSGGSGSSDGGGVSLKEFLLDKLAEKDKRDVQRFDAQEKANSAALVAAKEALSTALAAAERSSSAAMEANKILAAKAEEFADQKLQTHNSIRPWVQTLFDGANERITAIERRVSRFENREEGMSLTTKIIVGAVGLLATLVGLYVASKGGL